MNEQPEHDRYTVVPAGDVSADLTSGWCVVLDGAVPIVWYAADQRASADLQCVLFDDRGARDAHGG